jgi:O-antigen chain-terminating methyltransferase
VANAEDIAQRVGRLESRSNGSLGFDGFSFCRRFRGEEEEIRRRVADYVPLFGSVKRVLDVGCGRGEFLDACSEAGVGAYGVDVDPDMISHCHLRGFEAVCGDALEHLKVLPDRSLDGLFSAQVIEHLSSQDLVELLQISASKLKRGACTVIETINPTSFAALRWFYLDPTHRMPVPPETLQFLLEDAGFVVRDVLLSAPVPDEQKLATIDPELVTGNGYDTLAEHVNLSFEKLNDVLFGFQDYAVVAER